MEGDSGEAIEVAVPVDADPIDPNKLSVTLPPWPGVEAPLYLTRTNENYWIERLPGRVGYIQFNAVKNKRDESLTEFSRRVYDMAKQRKIRKLIIDVRHNNGGEGTLLYDFLQTIYWFERQYGSSSVVVLIGRNTYSAAQNFVTHLDYFSNAVFIGEPTGSKPVRVGDEAQFRLPYSGVIGQIASGYHKDAPTRDDRLWIAPEAPVRLRSVDYFAGRDPVLEAALEILANRAD